MPDNSFRRNSIDLNILKEKDEINESTRKGKKALTGLFDPNEKGIIWPLDTFIALRKMGFSKKSGLFLSSFCHLILAFPFNVLARQNEGGILRWIPDPLMRIRVDDVKVSQSNGDQGWIMLIWIRQCFSISQTLNARLSASEARQIIDQYSFGVRCYSRLRHLHQVDTVDGLG